MAGGMHAVLFPSNDSARTIIDTVDTGAGAGGGADGGGAHATSRSRPQHAPRGQQFTRLSTEEHGGDAPAAGLEPEPAPEPARRRLRMLSEVALGLGRIIASEIERPNLLANMVCVGGNDSISERRVAAAAVAPLMWGTDAA